MNRQWLLATGGIVLAGAAIGLTLARPGVTPPPLAVDGAAVFINSGCATCHDGPDSTAAIAVAPSLAGASTWAGTRVEGLTADEYLRQSVLAPDAVRAPGWAGPNGPMSGMPVLALGPAELDAVVAYLLADVS